jgi:hypothetical protein
MLLMVMDDGFVETEWAQIFYKGEQATFALP